MISIGIVGEPNEARRIRELCIQIFGQYPCRAKIIRLNAGPESAQKNIFDLLVVSGNGPLAKRYLPMLSEHGLLVVNLDDRNLYRYLSKARNTLITYGLGGKACVTVSAIDTGTIQCCVQRSLPILNTSFSVEEQEFPISIPIPDGNPGISCMLSAVTTALAAGLSPVYGLSFTESESF